MSESIFACWSSDFSIGKSWLNELWPITAIGFCNRFKKSFNSVSVFAVHFGWNSSSSLLSDVTSSTIGGIVVCG